MEKLIKNIVKKPTVVLVGRTNVGKSTLFNRLLEQSLAIVSPIAGTTRSPNYGDVIWRGRIFHLIDTGGLDQNANDPFGEQIKKQAVQSIKKADAVIFITDLRSGLTPADREFFKIVRRQNKPTLLCGNKAERDRDRAKAGDPVWRSFGLGEMYPVAAATGMGVGDLLDGVFEIFAKLNLEPPTVIDEYKPIKVAVMGKPNVGKSSLLNALVGSERAIVSEIANTTREPQDTLVRVNDDLFLFIDTAGIRKKMKSLPGLDALGVKKSLAVLAQADVVLFTLDIATEISSQDKHIAGLISDAAKGAVIIGNKWDLIAEKEPETASQTADAIHATFPPVDWAPIVFVSAKTGEHTSKLFKIIKEVQENRLRVIAENALDRFFQDTVRVHRPSRGKGVRHPYIYRMKQIGTAPPTFILSVRGRKETVHPSYLRFLEHQLRQNFNFEGTPIILKSKSITPSV